MLMRSGVVNTGEQDVASVLKRRVQSRLLRKQARGDNVADCRTGDFQCCPRRSYSVTAPFQLSALLNGLTCHDVHIDASSFVSSEDTHREENNRRRRKSV